MRQIITRNGRKVHGIIRILGACEQCPQWVQRLFVEPHLQRFLPVCRFGKGEKTLDVPYTVYNGAALIVFGRFAVDSIAEHLVCQ